MTREFPKTRRALAPLLMAMLALTGCAELNLDLREGLGGFGTSASGATAPRPEPDARGVISYPGYQVAVARRDDTVLTISERLGLDPAELARFNGINADAALRPGEIIALPRRVAEAPGVDGEVDIADLAGGAIERAPADAERVATSVETTTLPTTAEPVRHKVERGETAFTIARLYDVPVRSLAEWNGLGADLAVREGQFLLIPVASASPPAAAAVTGPGVGSATPAPPSSTLPVPLDADSTRPPAVAAAPAPSPAPVATPEDRAEFLTPVAGTVIRGYSPGRNEGVDFAAPAGTPVRAADDGVVAAITRDTSGVPIIVIRHDGSLLTVYTQVDGVKVAKDDRVTRGQEIATVRAGDPSFLHFEIRDGLDSVDPAIYLDL